MAIKTLEQITSIVKNRPHGKIIDRGRAMNTHLMLHLHGTGIDKCAPLARDDYFENEEAFKSRTKRPISNKDLMSRLLQEEDQVFSARGGSSNFGLKKEGDKKQMNKYLQDVRYGYSLRRWVKNFALNAYRADPMGVIFMEIDKIAKSDDGIPNVYPTYKSIQDIYDYETNGRRLEYICFPVKKSELKGFGIPVPAGEATNNMASIPNNNTAPSNNFKDKETQYYRFVDDEKDVIVKKEQDRIVFVEMSGNPLPNPWGRTPGVVVSDLIQFDNPDLFGSPLQFVIELADDFMLDRSIRGLQKKLHGFAKAVEPLMRCTKCHGTGLIAAETCGECNGTGYKLRTKISDVAQFPVEMLSESGGSGFDFKKFFGYVTPPIEALEYMDLSLSQCEQIIYFTYWGVPQIMQAPQGPQKQPGQEKTATEVVVNLKPKYSRLNTTADWAETTENLIADFIGQYYFPDIFKEAQISYGRSYILETPNDILEQFYNMRKNGVPKFILLDQLERYLRALYQNNPVVLAKMLKLLAVEPMLFTVAGTPAEGVTPDYTNAYALFPEWLQDQDQTTIATTKPSLLRDSLMEYVKAKNIPPPVDPNAPAPGAPAKKPKPATK